MTSMFEAFKGESNEKLGKLAAFLTEGGYTAH
jgi:hypothetical protein